MRLKNILFVCVLSLAVILSGCGAHPSAEQKETLPAQPFLAYREILEAAPAIEGEHEQLQDASFDDVQNRELFGDHYDCYALADLNQDGVPELIASTIINFRWTRIFVFTFAEGKAVLLKDPLDASGQGTFEQCSVANGAYITYICEENHIHSVWRGNTPVGEAEENHAYTLTGTTLTAVDCAVGESENTIYFSDIAKQNTAENLAAMTDR